MRRRAWPAAALVLYGLGLLAALAVSFALADDETAPARWALIAVPATLIGTASFSVRRAEHT
jgi:peptidoglycan/LPS O-acetylase OafA/YrhL